MKQILLGLVTFGVASAAVAQATIPEPEKSEERPGVSLSLESRFTFVDNFFYQTESSDEEQAWGVLLRPGAGIRGGNQRFTMAASASGEIGAFDQAREIADYEDAEFALGAEWTPARRHRFTYTGTYNADHDPFGTERTETDPTALARIDEWRRMQNTLSYRVGAPSDRYNLELKAAARDKRYTTNRDDTRFLDHEILGGELTGIYNYSPKTFMFASVIAADIQFDEVAPGFVDRSASELSYRVGARWAATAKTSGDFGVGFINRDPDDARRNDFNSVDWRAQITWAPTEYREFTFSTGRESQESFVNDVSFINNQFYAVYWIESWTPRLRTTLTAGYLDSEYVGSTRTDDAIVAGLSSQYRLSTSVSLIGGATLSDRDATGGGRDYARSQAYLGFRYAN